MAAIARMQLSLLMSLKRSEAARGPWRSWRGWRQASECVGLEHFVDIAVPGAMIVGKQPVCRRTLRFNRLDQWVERGALVLSLAVEPRAPPQAFQRQVHRVTGDIPQSEAAERRRKTDARHLVAQRL